MKGAITVEFVEMAQSPNSLNQQQLGREDVIMEGDENDYSD